MALHSTTCSMTCVLVATSLCILACLPCETEARTCVFRCMRNAITCKRKMALGGSDACCEKYYQCFMECNPDAEQLPPCNPGKGKRMDWGARTFKRAHSMPDPNEYFDL